MLNVKLDNSLLVVGAVVEVPVDAVVAGSPDMNVARR